MQATYSPMLISCKPLKNEFKTFQQIVISSDELSIGRGLSNTLVIPFLPISRNHCKFLKNDKNWILEDHSTFGVSINGVKLGKGKRKQISDQDIIMLDASHEFVYKFVYKDAELMPSSAKRIKLEPEETPMQIVNDIKVEYEESQTEETSKQILYDVKVRFEESQNSEIKHIEDKIESAKQIKTTNMILKEQLQSAMKRKIEKLESDFALKIENLKGEKNQVEKQKAILIEKRDTELATLKQEMEGKISELMEQIRKHNEIESELIVENNLLKEKLLKEREEFLLELNRESSLKQDMLNKLEAKMKEQEEIRLKEKQEFESLLQKETEQLRLAKEKELNELTEQKKQREMELMEELKSIKQNLEEQEKQKLEVQQQFSNQLEQMKKVTDEDKHKMEQLMHEKLNEAQQNAEKSIEILKSRVAEREIELSALAAERIQQQAEQSSEVISSLQEQLERVRSQLKSVESENMKLVQTSDKNKEGASNSTLTEFGEIMESELQCSICAELFVSAITLNCSHTFCKYCITMWKKKKKECPICRAAITSECKSLVLDSFIEKMVQNLTEEMKQKRKNMLQSREELESELNRPSVSTSRRSNSDEYEDDSEFLDDEEEYEDDQDLYEGYEEYEGFEEYEGNEEYEYSDGGWHNHWFGRESSSDSDSGSDDADDATGPGAESNNTAGAGAGGGNNSGRRHRGRVPGDPGAYYGGYGRCFRAAITSECKSLVLDSFIEKMVQNLTEEMKQKRKNMLQSREELESELNRPSVSTSRRSNSDEYEDDSEFLDDEEEYEDDQDLYEGYEEYEGFEEYEGNEEYEYSDGGWHNHWFGRESSSDSDSGSDDADDATGPGAESNNTAGAGAGGGNNSGRRHRGRVPGDPGAYYGGYGRCFRCGARGHWAPGCPLRNLRNS